jgi:site-specific DNA recombinase
MVLADAIDGDRPGQGGHDDAETQTSPPIEMCDRDLVDLHVERIVLRSRSIDITLQDDVPEGALAPKTIQIPWMPATPQARKGIAWQPAGASSLDPVTQDRLLNAIAKARQWVSDIVDGRAASFDEIAQREGKVERHVRFLVPLAFLSPRIVEAIARGEARPDLTVTMLARALPHRWAEQQSKLGIA